MQKITIDAGLSCPNRDGTLSFDGCIYCNPRGSGTGAYKKGLTVKQQIETGRKLLLKRYKTDKFIAYFQSFSNTYAPVEKLKTLYDDALSEKGAVGLAIGTRPDCVDHKVAGLLKSYAETHLVWLEYGLQSANDKTLKLINRGHNFNCFKDAVNLIKSKNSKIRICAHVIIGLPQESKEDIINTAKAVSKLGIHGVKIHLLYVIKGTKIFELYNAGQYRCMDIEEYVEAVCLFLEHLNKDIIIQRLTSDPHKIELVAPMWSLEKVKTLELINKELEKRGTYQGWINRHQKL